MIVKNGFIINPDEYLRPHYRISPFSNQDMFEHNTSNSDSNEWNSYVSRRWGLGKCHLTKNGREALAISLKLLNVKSETLVTILTTSGNYYISGCVTNTIEKFCRWNRKIETQTELILVIHEFGKTHPDLFDLKSLGIPIIEDCAYSFLNSNYNIGEVGDYCIYSLPKIFPMQIGGLITSSKKFDICSEITGESLFYIVTNLNSHILSLIEIAKKRNKNYLYLKEKFEEIGLKTRFNYNSGEIPGIFMFITPENVDLHDLKLYSNANGIESSVFYGENAFFIPCHQNLSFCDLDYFVTVLSNYFDHV